MNRTKELTLTAMFLALGMVLPMVTGQIPQVGRMLLPMHLPIFLCALICGWQYGAAIGAILPLVRTALFGVPVFYPDAMAIAFELAAYALVTGLLYSRSPGKCIRALYRSLLAAMVAGRVVRSVVQLSLMGLSGAPVALEAFFLGVILAGLPGILLQLVAIPAVMVALGRTKLVPFQSGRAHGEGLREKV